MHNFSGARSNTPNYIFATSLYRVECRYSSKKTQDKEKNTRSYLRAYTGPAANIFTGPQYTAGILFVNNSELPSVPPGSYCRDVKRPRPQHLIHMQHSGGSKNVLALLSFKNTDGHRFGRNCRCCSGEEGKKNVKSIFASNQTTGLNHRRPRPVSGFIIVGEMVRK